ncbi:T9SS type A sorting domain-containing protein [Bernardetia litoralis]|uniref:T9SS type A sorting domain-containing protein n=1 Tax=Bernardetia litoralis TaxID=999 RepID=UPI000306CF73|nr:T9SS type A sorting domain-containing protein [Bernardetia litoralis]
MKNLSFYYCQNKPFLFGKGLFLSGYCNGSAAGMGKIAVQKNKETSSDITLYPNPTHTEFNIKSSLKIESVTITNSLGQILLTSYKKKSISIESLSTGIYFVTIKLQNGEVKIQKIIIN